MTIPSPLKKARPSFASAEDWWVKTEKMAIYAVLFGFIRFVLSIYGYMLIATALVSWFPDLSGSRVGQFLDQVTGPYLRLFRFIPPLQFGGIALDLSFIVAVVVYFFIEQGILSVLFMLLQGLS